MSKEIKSAFEFVAMNGMKGQISTTMSPKDLEDEVFSAHVNERPARIITPSGPVLFHGLRSLITSQSVAVQAKSDIKVFQPGDVNVPPGSPPIKLN